MKSRREFITLVGGATMLLTCAAEAQQPMPLIGYVHQGTPAARRDHVSAFHRGLNESGLFEGRNVAIEYRWANDHRDRLPGLLSDLISRHVAVIVARAGTNTMLAAKDLRITTPIVFSTAIDPVRAGLVDSLNRPGGSVTGITDMGVDLAAKQVGLMLELLPQAQRFAVLINPSSALALSAVGKAMEVVFAPSNLDIDGGIAAAAQNRAAALFVAPDSFFMSRRVQLVTLAARHAIPAIYSFREFVEAGGLMSYGSSIPERERQVGIYTARILKGEKPAALPILRADKFEFLLNTQTAKIIGLEIPPTLLARADEVIE